MSFEHEEALKAQQIGSCVFRAPFGVFFAHRGTQNPKPKTQNSKLSIARSPICFN